MNHYPAAVWELAERHYTPLCVEVGADWRVLGVWGDVDRFGYRDVVDGVWLPDVMPALHGFAFEEGEVEHLWPFLATPSGLSAHCSIKRNDGGYLIIWFAAEREHAETQKIQQIANEVRLLEYRRQKLLLELREAEIKLGKL